MLVLKNTVYCINIIDRIYLSMKSFFVIISIILFLLFHDISAQQVYKTHKGNVKMTVVVDDTTYTFASNQLLTTIMKETMDIEMRLDISLLNFGVDSIQNFIRDMSDKMIVYRGKIKGSFLSEGNSQRPPAKTKVVGKLHIGDIKKQLNFYVTIEQISKEGGIVSAILTGNFTIPVKDFHIERYVRGIKDVIAIDFKQDLID
jgi:hypothetical protein